jgi:hypothetical protein
MTWRDEAKYYEQAWMSLKDQYAELARAIGCEVDAWFGDPLDSHSEVVERANRLRSQVTAQTPAVNTEGD